MAANMFRSHLYSHRCLGAHTNIKYSDQHTDAWRTDQDRISDFDVKLMDIDSEHLGIPDTDYKAVVKMSAAEFQRIIRDLSTIGDTGTDPLARMHVWALP